jgi:hypothetical protein
VPLIYEVSDGRTPWRRAGILPAGSPPGTISHVAGDQRELIVFGCLGDRSVVGISVGGADVEAGIGRFVSSSGVDVVATLTDGEEFEMPVTSDRGISYQARWRHTTT